MHSNAIFKIETQQIKLLANNLKLLAFFFIMLLSGNYVAAATPTEESIRGREESMPYDYRCFNNQDSDSVERIVPLAEIGLQVSNRATHQLLSRIFAIFLREVLHYDNVYLIDDYDEPMRYLNISYERQKLADTLEHIGDFAFLLGIFLSSYQPSKPNLNMIDLEVWMPALAHQLIPSAVDEAGSSLSPGRFGWFVNKRSYGNAKHLENLHYTIFQDRSTDIYKQFLLPEYIVRKLNTKQKLVYQSPFCEEFASCVTLLAEHKTDTKFLEEQIIATKSYLNVIWLGDRFDETLKYLLNSYEMRNITNHHFIVAHWQPSEIINVEQNFYRIIMPQCEQYAALQHSLCKYEQTPLLKYYFGRLSIEDKELLFTLRRFRLNNNSLQQLLRSLAFKRQQSGYSKKALPQIYNAIACDWLQNNSLTYKNWITEQETKTALIIGGIFSFEHPEALFGAQQAVEHINSNNSVLRNFDLIVYEVEGKCEPDLVLRNFIHYYNVVNLLGVLGPACSDTLLPLAGLSKHTQLPILTYGATTGNFSDREAYPYVFRLIGDDRQLNTALIQFLLLHKWKRVAMITDQEQKYLEQVELTQYGIELIANKKLSSQISTADIQKNLLDLKEKRAKIIFTDLNSRNAQLTLCEAFKLQMISSKGYVWILPFKLSSQWNRTLDCTAEQLEKAAEGYYVIRHAADKELSSPALNSTYQGDNLGHYLIGFAYDAVWTYALAANKLFKQKSLPNLRNKNLMDQFAQLLWKTDFPGISGRVRFGSGGTRITHISIMKCRQSKWREIGRYIPEIVGNESSFYTKSGILQMDELEFPLPTDGRYDCDFSSLVRIFDLDCEHVYLVVTILLCLWFIIIAFLISYIFWRRRYSKKLKRSARIMRNFGIDLLPPKINKNSLDKWEISRNNLIINRRLGEGAFGTVYGGEARIGSEKWAPVAVKSLKTGASFEDRVDFLSEAEAMKRFDHNNIIKLLGVCLQSEPIYTVMEFMLYGDLKTFLLARRHLASEKLDEDSEISAKQLTLYALDVARGLAYLAAHRFVHRDIACRNCLVNADRTVKIGDFGMARATYDNDYYRFNRKSMLPVRWMAPEALNSGIFTPATDVWSFGMVLYEIITFGAYPYEGLNNGQVLEYVKSGKTIKLPAAVKPNLEKLIKACWSQEQKDRPLADDVVEYLRENPRLLGACITSRSVSLEFFEAESSELELELELLSKMYNNPPNGKNNDYEVGNETNKITDAAKKRIAELLSEIDMRKYTEMDAPREYSNCSTICVSTPTTPDGYSLMSPLLAPAKNVILKA